MEAHHGFDDEQVDAGIIQGLGLFTIDIDEVVKGQFAHRIELLARHGHITGNQCFPLSRFLGDSDQALIDDDELVIETVFSQFQPISCERRRIDNL